VKKRGKNTDDLSSSIEQPFGVFDRGYSSTELIFKVSRKEYQICYKNYQNYL
jgi:hypothetical protein